MKRKHSAVGALGLGGYASDESEGNESQGEGEDEEKQEEEEKAQEEQAAGVLLPHYHSRESIDLGDAEAGEEEGARGEPQGRAQESPQGAAETSGADGERATEPDSAELDPDNPLNRLPPELREPLPTRCPEQLQAKFSQYLAALRSKGISLTDQISHRRAFRNPDFLQKLVEHFNVSEHGSAFPTDVFDPANLPQEDYIDQLLRSLEREQERRARLREAASQQGTARIEFAKGQGPLGHIPASSSASNLALQQAAAYAQAAVARVVASKR